MATSSPLVAAFDDLEWRRMIAHSTDTDALRAAAASGPIVFYCGFDPTAPSLHFGNLVQLVTMRRLQLAGHRPIGLVGGATGMIGDPSGRSVERALNDVELVTGWVERIRGQVERLLSFEGDSAAVMANNLDWTGPMPTLTFLRDLGKHFSIGRMLAKESVSARISAGGISYTEFSYQVLQALDYLELYRRHGCTLQTGGSDQWGNLTAGVDLIRRVEGASVHALATPLLTRPGGAKYAKSEGDTIWLDPALTSPYAFYQQFLNLDDALVGEYLRCFSFRSHGEIEELERLTAERPESRSAQRALADEVTALVHGNAEAQRAADASSALFGGAGLASLDEAAVRAAVDELPHATWPAGDGDPTILDLLVATGLAESRGAAKRVVADGGAYLNNRKVSDGAAPVSRAELLHGRWLIIRRGRRQVAIVTRG